MKYQSILNTILVVAFSSQSFSSTKNVPFLLANKNSAIENQYQTSVNLLLRNLSYIDGRRGAIPAAPSRANPDYYYHWVRDAALTTESLIGVYNSIQSRSPLKENLKRFFLDTIDFNILLQKNSLKHLGLGEPKFYVSGDSFKKDWGRPQNDGPALRSIVNIELLSLAARERWPEYPSMLANLYNPQLNTFSVVKNDLEFVAHNWMRANFDLWEEVCGHHFYNLMAQRKAMHFGTMIAKYMKDPGAADYYQQQMVNISSQLDYFWNPSVNYIFATSYSNEACYQSFSNRNRGRSGLDSAALLGVLHSEMNQVSFSVVDPRVFSTYLALKSSFSSIYNIGKIQFLNTPFGRYPEDTYDGYTTTSIGNPWFLITAGSAEYLYRLATSYIRSNQVVISFANQRYFSNLLKLELRDGQVISSNQPQFKQIIDHLINEADLYLLRVIYHTDENGSLSEQFNREIGYMQGAPNLTWSYAAYITAKLRRDQILSIYKAR